MNEIKQRIIVSIASMKEFEKLLKSEMEYCIIMDFHISLIEIMIKQLHDVNKKALVHIDLIKGLSSDEAGCEYLCQKMKADGVISTKAKVIECANKHKKIAIQRMFLIDSKSLEKGLQQLASSKADYIEVLPGIAHSIIPTIKKSINIPIISGGLIRSESDVENCLNSGAVAVSISNLDIAMKYFQDDKLVN